MCFEIYFSMILISIFIYLKGTLISAFSLILQYVLFQSRFVFYSNHIGQCWADFNIRLTFNSKSNIYNESNCWSTLCFLVCFNRFVVKYDLLTKHACLLFNNWIDASSCILLSEETYMLQKLELYLCQTNNYFMYKIKGDLHAVRV